VEGTLLAGVGTMGLAGTGRVVHRIAAAVVGTAVAGKGQCLS
jgi:hypothetical protein